MGRYFSLPVYFVCTFYTDILGNKIDLELPSGLTLRRKSIGPFADFSYKMVIFKRLKKYLKLI